MKYLITYENMHWCGGELHCVVEAESADEALYLAEDHMEDTQRELFSDEYSECEEGEDEECSYTVISTEEFDPSHEHWAYYKDPSQSEFYPEV